MASSLSVRPQTSTSKRSWSPGTPDSSDVTSANDTSNDGDRNDAGVPAFLRQSNIEISSKFEELEWLQQFRLAEGHGDTESLSQWAIENTKEVKSRNRYGNVQAWANSRIHLKVPEGTCDYINASPISLRNSKTGVETKYIAAQGPKEIGLSHFWQMIWHETTKVAVIVMLTQTAESGKEKCFQYFPMGADNDSLTLSPSNGISQDMHGSIKLDEETYDEASRSTVRKLTLTFGEETKIVWHLLYTAWMDFSVPEDENREALLELITLSRNKNDNIPSNPRIIHCSAGVGRSGTFIALEHLVAELEAGSMAEANDSVDVIFDTVNRLREQRMMMVQSPVQYQFLYDVLREQFRKVQTEKERKAIEETPAVLATEKLSSTGSGEPSPKVMRLAKGIKAAFLRDRSRSRPRQGTDDTSGEGKAPSKC